VHWVKEIGPNVTSVSGLQGENRTFMTGVVELDRPASDPAAQIIGGELLNDDDTGANRLTNNPFMWIATDTSQDPSPTTFDARRNPFVKAQAVKDLIAISQQQNPSGRAGRLGRRGNAQPDCDAVRSQVITCIVTTNSRNNCVAQLGGAGGFDGGIAILEQCGFL
jgi:hypothetical protein